MRIPKILAIAMGLVVGALGVLGVVAPSLLLEFGRSLHTNSALHVVAVVRVAFGAILLWVAPVSRTPRVLRILGALIVIAGVITPFVGVERFHAMLDWWSAQGALVMRAWAMVAIVFGLFVVYAVVSPRRDAA